MAPVLPTRYSYGGVAPLTRGRKVTEHALPVRNQRYGVDIHRERVT